MCLTMVTGVRHNEQPGDLEAGEGAHVTYIYTYRERGNARELWGSLDVCSLRVKVERTHTVHLLNHICSSKF